MCEEGNEVLEELEAFPGDLRDRIGDGGKCRGDALQEIDVVETDQAAVL
jgi:hypothetical protein